MIYLDNAATSYNKPCSVYLDMFKNTVMNSANAGRGGHFYSIRAAKGIFETQEAICELFNISSPDRLAFTQNATQAINYAILGILTKNSHAVITQMDHNSVLRPVHKTCSYTVVKADREGFVNPEDIKRAIRPTTKMIIMTHASNVCGAVEPIREVSKIAHENGIVFMVDAAQTAGCIDIDVEKDGIDLLAFSGHKGLMTPMGVGGLFVKEGISIKPIITGGTGSMSKSILQPDFMPDMLQSGTLNAPAIISAKKSVDLILRETPKVIGDMERELAKKLINELKNIKGIKIYGPWDKNRNGTVAFNIDGLDSIRVSNELNDKYKICTRGGWHCAYPAHQAIGSEKSGAIRASFGYFNTKRDVNKVVDAVSKIAKRLK